jgi:SNF2 family DNA or RNA helicase
MGTSAGSNSFAACNGAGTLPVPGGWSWFAPPTPQVMEIVLAAEQHPKILESRLDFDFPRPITVAIPRVRLQIRSFRFAEPEKGRGPIGAKHRAPTGTMRGMDGWSGRSGKLDLTPFSGPFPIGVTRIKPPGDVIKLEDRLNYLLQPPLESILAEKALGFPCRPFPYQFEGMAFLYPRHSAILADEMGLGKTMQAITGLRLLLHRGEVRQALLVCPKSLVTNWQREFQHWAPELPVMVIEGDQARRAWQWQLPDVPLRIANYEILVRDRGVFENFSLSPTTSWCPERAGVRAEREEQGSEVRGQGPGGGIPHSAGYPLGGIQHLPSSPHPNPLLKGEGIAVIPFFDLVVLDESQRIKNRHGATSQAVRAIPRRRSWALTGTPVENSSEDLLGIFEFLAPGFLSPDLKPRKLGQMVGDYVLRRTKDQVLDDLPPLLVHDELLDLTPPQRASYQLAEEEGVVHLTELGAAVTIQHVFELVIRLKQICNFDPITGESAKLERLEADLEEIAASGRKAIIFSQWVGTLKRLVDCLRRFGPLEYHGKIPPPQRDAVIRRFREDASRHVILMSYGAGGVGLNLHFAQYVFLFDRWWNPAVEDQAVNRAHRIGIQSPVHVTRFLMLETIEERIDRILQEKRDLFDTIFSDRSAPRKLGLTQEELFRLFQLPRLADEAA